VVLGTIPAAKDRFVLRTFSFIVVAAALAAPAHAQIRGLEERCPD